MASVSPTEIVSVIRQNYFNDTITISGENVINVSCVAEGGKDSGITIITSTSSIEIFGNYFDTNYEDQASFVNKGSSNILEEPTNVIGPIWGPNSLVPPNKELYDFDQDITPDRIQNYIVTVTEEPEPESMQYVVTNFIVFQRILNDWSSGTIALKEYYGT
jgi:hypothetical protein